MERQCPVCGRKFSWSGHGRPRATCSQECHRLRKNEQREQTRQRAVARGCPDDMHGSSSGYTHYKCTCPPCRLWAKTYKRSRRAALKEGARMSGTQRKEGVGNCERP